MARVLVVNPNSTDRITNQIREAVAASDGLDIEVVTSVGGPPAIESDDDVVASVGPMLATITQYPADAYVVACFSDPGLDEVRELTGLPAFGIAESAVREAIERGGRVGIVSSVEASIPRHERYWRRRGLAHHVVDDVAVGLGVLQLDTPDAYERVRQAAGQMLEGRAATVILGCTGMTHMRAPLEAELGVPVIDPCEAALAAAAGALAEARS